MCRMSDWPEVFMLGLTLNLSSNMTTCCLSSNWALLLTTKFWFISCILPNTSSLTEALDLFEPLETWLGASHWVVLLNTSSRCIGWGGASISLGRGWCCSTKAGWISSSGGGAGKLMFAHQVAVHPVVEPDPLLDPPFSPALEPAIFLLTGRGW
jgi:hypothetical protein